MKTNKYKVYLEVAAFIIAILFLFYLAIISDVPKPQTGIEKIIFIVALIFIIVITLGIHELGHLLTGLLNGFKFNLFVIGPLGLRNENNKVKIYFNKDLSYYGGVAATTPKNINSENAKIFSRIVLAGPLTSFFWGIICIGFSFLLFGLGKALLFFAGIISIAIFFATTIPTKTGVFFSDRKRFQRLISKGIDQKVEIAMMNIIGREAQDNSYKNIDNADIELLINDKVPFIKYFGNFCLICKQIELDVQKDEISYSEYNKLAEKMPKSIITAMDKELEKIKLKQKNKMN